MRQEEALEILKLGFNVFLTGAAGSGKTFVLNQYIKYLNSYGVKVAVTASTGIAATHIGGHTIHSWSGMGIRESISDEELGFVVADRRVRRNLVKAKVLIIDEISMLHEFQLNLVDRLMRKARECNEPFGDCQVVVCGDFFQLPPVSKNGESTKFAYEAESWREANFRVCYLKEQHRQSNDELLSVLNDIRRGTPSDKTVAPLRTRYKKDPEGKIKPTLLYARNINVDAINERELEKLPGEAHSFSMRTVGFKLQVEALKRSCLAPANLRLKVGAQVMFVKNAADGEYVNGTRGVVTDFEKESGFPVVTTFDGDSIVSRPQEWRFEDTSSAPASLTQVPLRLAWAITIHKSQGMTLDAAEVDLSDAFQAGMGYVALSRVRALNGLKLIGLNQMALKVNENVLVQDKFFLDESEAASLELKTLDAPDLAKRQEQVLFSRFEAKVSSGARIDTAPQKREKRLKKISTYDLTLELVSREVSLDEIARQRELKVGTIISHLEELKGMGRLPNIGYIKSGIPDVDFSKILDQFKQSVDGKLAPVFEKFGGQYNFETLKIVRLFVGLETI